MFPFRYIEASKARLYHSESQSRASVAQSVLLYVFGNILKMLHPFMPFVTEELWQVSSSLSPSLSLSLCDVLFSGWLIYAYIYTTREVNIIFLSSTASLRSHANYLYNIWLEIIWELFKLYCFLLHA